MATTGSPIFNSPPNMISAFSPYTEFSLSPNSPAAPNTPGRFQSLTAQSNRLSAESESLRPNSLEVDGGLSPNMAPSPSDMVGPSPVTSNGTESTDIEDDPSEGVELGPPSKKFVFPEPALRGLNTSLPDSVRYSGEDEPASVIHAPQGYGDFTPNSRNTNPPQSPPLLERSTPKPFKTVPPSDVNGGSLAPGDRTVSPSPVSPPPITTDVAPAGFGIDNLTPRAQSWHEFDSASSEKLRHRSSSASSSLEGIPEDFRESDENGDFSDAFNSGQEPEQEVSSLQTALHECWTLCNTLARMSTTHRERVFVTSGTKIAHEMAWKTCWRLCQKLYNTRDGHQDLHVRSTLDLCRDFCQALFDVRRRNSEISDGVLRVSFELNNHLYNTHDRNLPDAFRERTLDFYITLCHRLMKQRSELAEETDSLLRACWGLAEMLFSLRQNRSDGKPADEELLGSAVQACWDLCDLFREGWTQVRPDRGTPRASQSRFSPNQLIRSLHSSTVTNQHPAQTSRHTPTGSGSSHQLNRVKPRHVEPETPTTEFEDTPVSPEETSPAMPNILVLGPSSSSGAIAQTRWSSNSSNLSGYSQGSNKTSSTVKTTTASGVEESHLARLKILILKAAMNAGYQRPSPSNSPPSYYSSTSSSPTPGASSASGSDSRSSGNTVQKVHSPTQTLQAYIAALPTTSFGPTPWHTSLLASYTNLILADPVFSRVTSGSNSSGGLGGGNANGGLPEKGRRASAAEVAKAVVWMVRERGAANVSGNSNDGGGGGDKKFFWLRDLYRLVFGFGVEDALADGGTGRKGVGITV